MAEEIINAKYIHDELTVYFSINMEETIDETLYPTNCTQFVAEPK